MADLLGADFGLAEAHKLYAPVTTFCCSTKTRYFSSGRRAWCDLFNTNFDVLLYDLTSTYFEINASDVAEGVTSATTATAGTSGRTARRW